MKYKEPQVLVYYHNGENVITVTYFDEYMRINMGVIKDVKQEHLNIAMCYLKKQKSFTADFFHNFEINKMLQEEGAA